MADAGNPFSRYPSVTPYLYYADPAEALDWLARAFGFPERGRIVDDDGRITHAEVAIGADGVVMFGSAGSRYATPSGSPAVASSLYVVCDDIDGLFERAVSAGARVIEAPVDRPWGDRECVLVDHEGHHWYFWSRRGQGPD